MKVSLSLVRLDAGTQQRVQEPIKVIEAYTELYKDGVVLPRPTLIHDGVQFYPTDGHCRIKAAMAAGKTELDCEVANGTLRDAILLSCSANATHGARRTNLDARRAVDTLLNDSEWSKFPNTWIADKAGVTEGLIRKIKLERNSGLEPTDIPPEDDSYSTSKVEVWEGVENLNKHRPDKSDIHRLSKEERFTLVAKKCGEIVRLIDSLDETETDEHSAKLARKALAGFQEIMAEWGG